MYCTYNNWLLDVSLLACVPYAMHCCHLPLLLACYQYILSSELMMLVSSYRAAGDLRS